MSFHGLKPLTTFATQQAFVAEIEAEQALVHAHYLSQKDIEICAAFDIADEFDTHPNFPGIQSLHQTLRATYPRQKPLTPRDSKRGRNAILP